jgi:hypothetical protein
VELQGRVEQLERDGLGLVAISYDSTDVLAGFARQRGITFPLLSDAGSAVIKQYGLLNTTVPEGNRAYGVPFSGTFLLDAKGAVTNRFLEDAQQERDTVSSVFVKLGSDTTTPGTNTSAPHLDVTTSVSDATVAPGTRFSLVLDITPGPHIHVYAPGVSGYKPIALRLDAQPPLVVRNAQFPKPEDYFFEPLNEHVAVYQRRFRIVQDVMFDASPQGEAALKNVSSVTIAGVLEYQACDDKVCFIPQSVPVSWTVAVRPLDRERLIRP